MDDTATFLPSYDPCPEYNTAILRKSVPLMMTHGVSAHPINYAIWYEYVAGNNPKLIEAIDELIKNKRLFDDATSLGLYKKHICNASIGAFEKINSDLQTLIENTNNAVQDSSSQVSDVGFNVEAGSSKLEHIENLSDVKNVLSDIVAETRKLLDISNTLKSRLNEANQELESLRLELTKVRELATTDALTGLLNRRAFDEALAAVVDHAGGRVNCLLILDLDHFKSINDNFGHLIGDKVLRYTAELIKKHTAAHHHVARYGGEELAVIMPDTPPEAALVSAEKIREAMAKSQLKHKDSGLAIGTVTLSIGVASLTRNDGVESFIARADSALYRAKENGRNKVVFLDQ